VSVYDKQMRNNEPGGSNCEKARTIYLKTAQKKSKTKKKIRLALGKQLLFFIRNIKHIYTMLDAYDSIPLNAQQYKYLLVIHETYRQQKEMRQKEVDSAEHPIVSIQNLVLSFILV
jgi:transposase, IS5 family